MAAVAAPIMGPVSDIVMSSFGDTIIVEGGLHVGFDLGSKLLDEFLIDKPIEALIPMHDSRLATTKVKTLGITLKYHHTVEDAALGFYRSSLHKSVLLSYPKYQHNRLCMFLERDHFFLPSRITLVRLSQNDSFVPPFMFNRRREGVVFPIPICKWAAAYYTPHPEA